MWDAVYLGYYDRRGPDGKLWRGLRTLDEVIGRLTEAQRVMTDADAPLLAWGFDPAEKPLAIDELDRSEASKLLAAGYAVRRVLGVDDDQIGGKIASQPGQMSLDRLPPGAPDHIAEQKDVQERGPLRASVN